MREATGLRAVLDTNVYLSVFVFPESRVFDLWRLAREGRYTVVISPFILREFMEKLREKFGVPAAAREIVKRRVLRKADIVQPQTVPTVIADDPTTTTFSHAPWRGSVCHRVREQTPPPTSGIPRYPHCSPHGFLRTLRK